MISNDIIINTFLFQKDRGGKRLQLKRNKIMLIIFYSLAERTLDEL